jgi:3-deoxy-manno-octulosonate cytidylyltransferase (CMP-KDO synthetase)
MNIIAIIPARMGSSRFPGKPLAPLHGVPLVGHVYFRTKLNPCFSGVYIATCDEEIRRYALEIGADCVMTSPAHMRASDRTAEAAGIVERSTGRPVDIVVMVQGDEPMIVPAMLDEALQPLFDDESVQLVNLMAPIDEAAAADPNEIKVALDRRGNALYFSRHALPWQVGSRRPSRFKQVCVIPFRRSFLTTFAALEPTPFEQAESIDMLRALEHGYPVRMASTAHVTCSVDTPADLACVTDLMRGDPLLRSYGGATWQKFPDGKSSSPRPMRVRASIATVGRSRMPAARSSSPVRRSGSRKTIS